MESARGRILDVVIAVESAGQNYQRLVIRTHHGRGRVRGQPSWIDRQIGIQRFESGIEGCQRGDLLSRIGQSLGTGLCKGQRTEDDEHEN